MDSLKQFSTIQQVSQKLDVPKPTLRFWEKEFEGILVPLRTNGGQRRYSSEHIAIVAKINALKKNGLSLAEIKRSIVTYLDKPPHQDGIEILAERVVEIVKTEILRYFSQEDRR